MFDSFACPGQTYAGYVNDALGIIRFVSCDMCNSVRVDAYALPGRYWTSICIRPRAERQVAPKLDGLSRGVVRLIKSLRGLLLRH